MKKSLGTLLHCDNLDVPIPEGIPEDVLREVKKNLIGAGQDITFENFHKECSKIRYKQDMKILRDLWTLGDCHS